MQVTNRTMRIVLVTTLAMMALLAAMPPTTTATPGKNGGPGNSGAAHQCQKGGWQSLVRVDDASSFANQGECVSYAAQGGTLDSDDDGDGWANSRDCASGDPAVNPGASEIDDGVDNNCDGAIDDGFDLDGDGYTPIFGADCNDGDPAIHPGASELGNEVDDNCDGAIDEGFDADGDGLTNPEEAAHGTDPTMADTDGDGLSDGDEVGNYGTDPTVADTDGDGLSDGDEVATGTNPNDATSTASANCIGTAYKNWIRADGTGFADAAACQTYVAGDGELDKPTLTWTITPTSGDWTVTVTGRGLQPGTWVWFYWGVAASDGTKDSIGGPWASVNDDGTVEVSSDTIVSCPRNYFLFEFTSIDVYGQAIHGTGDLPCT